MKRVSDDQRREDHQGEAGVTRPRQGARKHFPGLQDHGLQPRYLLQRQGAVLEGRRTSPLGDIEQEADPEEPGTRRGEGCGKRGHRVSCLQPRPGESFASSAVISCQQHFAYRTQKYGEVQPRAHSLNIFQVMA